MRAVIIGNAGSGKTTLARRLAASAGAALLDLDTVAWAPGQVAVARDPAAAEADVRAFCASHAHWVVEGCYGRLASAALAFQPLLILLDPGLAQCEANCRNRPWESHKYASKAEQDARLPFLLSWVAEYYTRDGDLSLAGHEALFSAYAGPKQRIAHAADAVLGPDAAPASR